MTNQNSGLLWAYFIHQGKIQHEYNSLDQIECNSHKNGFLWIHLDRTCHDSSDWINKKSGLKSIVAQSLLLEETRPRFTSFDEGDLVILRGVNLNNDSTPEDMVSIRVWIDGNKIITVRGQRIRAAHDLRDTLVKGKSFKTQNDILIALIGNIIERMEPIITQLNISTDDSEENVIERPDISLRESIVNIRKQAIILKRYMSPQKDVVYRVATIYISGKNKDQKIKMFENYDRMLRYVEDLDAIRERTQIVQDELTNVLTDKLNKNMYLLSIIASIFLPLGFLTGLLGINVGGIPGAENQNAFLIFSGILVSILVIQIYFFRRMKWF